MVKKTEFINKYSSLDSSHNSPEQALEQPKPELISLEDSQQVQLNRGKNKNKVEINESQEQFFMDMKLGVLEKEKTQELAFFKNINNPVPESLP